MSTVNDTTVLVRRLDVTARRTDQVMELSDRAEGGVLLETVIGRYVLDRDARVVWLLVDGRRTLAEIADGVAGQLSLPVGEIRGAVHEVSERLLDLGLVEVVSDADAEAFAQLTVSG
ncbi:PqqD family protein [Streptomyces sp. NPDC056361]|uniref:PqqD family protein n=1 Tax=Streptomyces sp. NPDC056361 TaxID=3345795 RepID=UPI0035D84C4F